MTESAVDERRPQLPHRFKLRALHGAVADYVGAAGAEFEVSGEADACFLDVTLAAGDCDLVGFERRVRLDECFFDQGRRQSHGISEFA